MRGKAMLNDFVANFLQQPVQGMLVKAAFFTPHNWIRLLSPNFHRIDVASELYDEVLFKNQTFKDLQDVQPAWHAPLIIANSTRRSSAPTTSRRGTGPSTRGSRG